MAIDYRRFLVRTLGTTGILASLIGGAATESFAQTQDVTWRSTAGVTVSGSDLTKTAATGWGNSGASSFETLESEGFVEFSASGAAMLGLNVGDTNQSYQEVDFAIYISSGTLQIYESGTNRGSFGSVTTSDRFRVEVSDGLVRYRKNGLVIYTSTVAAGFPLLVDAALNGNGSTLTDVRIGQTSFGDDVGTSVSEGTLTKVGSTGWNAGAVAKRRIFWGDGFVEFSALETDKTRAAGLSYGDSDKTVLDIDFAIVLNADASIEIQEAGTSRGTFGPYSGGDRFRVEVENGTVTYLRNGTALYTSSVAPVFPLWADTALYDTGATLEDLVVSEMLWADASGVALVAGSVLKTGSSGWNAGAASTASIASGDGFVEFTATETDSTRACGLADDDASYDPAEIDFAIQLQDNGDVRVYESGTLRGTYGTYLPGDRFRVEVRLGQVVYLKNGVTFYTSGVSPDYPLRVDVALDSPNATLRDVRLGTLVWKNTTGVAVWGYGLLKTAAAGWGNSGAASTIELASGDGGVEFSATALTSSRMLGLSNGDSSQDFSDIDFAIFPSNGSIQIYEKGSNKGNYGSYAIGDRLRVAVEGGVVKYRRNGTLLYTSAQAVVYPLLADAALNTTGTALTGIVFTGSFGPAAAEPPVFSPSGGTYTTPQTVTMTSSTPFAEIRYTTDGGEPSELATLYTSPISVATTTTLRAKAYRADLAPSPMTMATYQMNFGTLAAPTVGPASGSYVSSVSVTMSAAAGATIRYTTDGTDPTSSSSAYTGPVAVEATTTLKAKAFHADYVTSAATTNAYTIVVATPTFTPGAGSYGPGQTITVSTATAGATIRYTLTGVDPTTSDPTIASGGTLVAGNFTLKATAWKAGCTTSAVQAAAYVVTGPLTNGVAIGGSQHTLVAQSDGTVWSWGANSNGQLGDGTWVSRPVPGRVNTLTGVTALAAGPSTSVALRADGTVWTWGYNGYGQLGDGTTGSKNSPLQVAIAGATAIAAGEVHVVAAKSDGTVWAWGYNNEGQLGDGTTTQRLTPVQVSGLTSVTRVAAGESHSLALKSDGTVWAWGWNYDGQLGDGSTTDRSTPVRVDGLSSITQIAAGTIARFSLALRDDGTVWAWGQNYQGQLGDGTNLARITPVRVNGLSGVVAIRAGNNHALALKSDGTVWSWGQGNVGQLGDGSTEARTSPVLVQGLAGISVIGTGNWHSLAIDADGGVWAWGWNYNGVLGDGTTIDRTLPIRIAESGFAWKVATTAFSLAPGTYTTNQTVTLTNATPGATIRYTTSGSEPTEADPSIASGGTVGVSQSLTLKAKAWKSGMPPSNTAAAVYELKVLTPGVSPNGGSYGAVQNVTLTCATSGATIRYTTDGSEPTGTSTAYTGPVPISATTTLKAKAFKAGWTESDTRTATYTLNLGTLASPTSSPAAGTYVDSVSVTLSGPAGATIRYTTNGSEPTASSTAYAGAIELTATTTIKAKAFDPSYAASSTTTSVYTIKAPAPTLSPIAGSYGIGQIVTATTPGGITVRYTVNGADPTASDGVLPAEGLMLVESSTIKARGFRMGASESDVATASYTVTGSLPDGGLTAGDAHSGARSGGSVWTWGRNTNGQLGDGTTTPRPIPVSLANPSSVTGLDGGRSHTVAVKSDGTVWAWGLNTDGQLGDGTTTQRVSPVQVSGLTGVVAVAAGAYHSVALKADGTVWTWGENQNGQLGDGTTTQRTTPVQVSGLTDVTAVGAGERHSLARKSDGTVWAWGFNSNGQLGDGTTTQRTTPVQVSGLTGVTAVAGGRSHSLALKSDGTVWAWGLNSSGQLGDGTFTQRTTPVAVANLSGVRRIAAGDHHSLAARADGSAWGWGWNGYGQLGDGTIGVNRTSAVPVADIKGVVELAGGSVHSLAMDKDGAVWGWGENDSGQVGDGTTLRRLTPVRLSDASFTWKVATPAMSPTGGSYGTALTVTLTCATAGATIRYTTNGADPTEADPGVASGGTVAVGITLTLKARAYSPGVPPSNVAVETYALVVAAPTASLWSGTYNTPQTAALSTTTPGATIRYTTDGTVPLETSTVYTAPIVVDHSLTLRAKAWLSGWTESNHIQHVYTMKVATPTFAPPGGSYSGAQNVTVSSATPGAVIRYTTTGLEPTESDAVVASGGTVPVSQSSMLRAKAWKPGGWTTSNTALANYAISLGTAATPTFSPIAGTYAEVKVVTISTTTAGATIRYTLDGSDPNLTSRVYRAPIAVDATATVRARAFKRDFNPSAAGSAAYVINLPNTVAPVTYSPPAGSYPTTQTITLTTSTSGATIHYTTDGDEPTTADPSVASGGTVTVDRGLSLKTLAVKSGMTASPVRRADYAITGAVAGGRQRGFALKVDATLWGWGYNANGQVGNGSTTQVATPVQVLSGVRGVSANESTAGHTLAVKWDGSVWGWGHNNYGVIGDGTTQQRLSPVEMSSPYDFVAIATGDRHSLAIRDNGQVYAWGMNTYGQLGNDSTTNSLTPVLVNSLTDVVAVAAGAYHSLALTRSGQVYAWGRNADGQLGDGTTTNRDEPVLIPSLAGVTAISAGGDHSLALKTDGSETGDVWMFGNGELLWGITTTTPVRIMSGVAALSSNYIEGLYLRRDAWSQVSIWGSGSHSGDKLTPGVPGTTGYPLRIGVGDYVAVAAGFNSSLAIKRDTTVVNWGTAGFTGGDGLVLGYSTGTDDPDGDGLTTNLEWQIGSDPWKADTNGDGLRDGQALTSGKSATNIDMDGDGLTNAVEIGQGTDPLSADTDGDGQSDSSDCFPIDPTRWNCPSPTPGDTTPPVITLSEPTGASLISVVPPQ